MVQSYRQPGHAIRCVLQLMGLSRSGIQCRALAYQHLRIIQARLAQSPGHRLERDSQKQKDDASINIWDSASSRRISKFEGHRDICNNLVAWQHDLARFPTTACVKSVGRSSETACLASASDDTSINIWDLRTDSCVSILEAHSAPINSVAWHRNKMRLASALMMGQLGSGIQRPPRL